MPFPYSFRTIFCNVQSIALSKKVGEDFLARKIRAPPSPVVQWSPRTPGYMEMCFDLTTHLPHSESNLQLNAVVLYHMLGNTLRRKLFL